VNAIFISQQPFLKCVKKVLVHLITPLHTCQTTNNNTSNINTTTQQHNNNSKKEKEETKNKDNNAV